MVLCSSDPTQAVTHFLRRKYETTRRALRSQSLLRPSMRPTQHTGWFTLPTADSRVKRQRCDHHKCTHVVSPLFILTSMYSLSLSLSLSLYLSLSRSNAAHADHLKCQMLRFTSMCSHEHLVAADILDIATPHCPQRANKTSH